MMAISDFSNKEHYEYSAYGITAILDANNIVKTVASEYQIKSDLANPFGFQGMWRDEHTGLYHTHYRIYNPQFARWLTPDPAGYMNGMNLYRFYGGPNGVDPLGAF
jgi:RHS repeat-associated protein